MCVSSVGGVGTAARQTRWFRCENGRHFLSVLSSFDSDFSPRQARDKQLTGLETKENEGRFCAAHALSARASRQHDAWREGGGRREIQQHKQASFADAGRSVRPAACTGTKSPRFALDRRN